MDLFGGAQERKAVGPKPSATACSFCTRRVLFSPILGLALIATLGSRAWSVAIYWDVNGSAPGAGLSGVPSGTWDTGGGKNNWNASSDGTGAQVAWSSGSDAVFAAGSDATGSYNVTLVGNPSLASLSVEEGLVSIPGSTISGNTLNFGATAGAPVNIAAGATFSQLSTNIFAGTGGLTKTGAGTLVLRGTNTFSKTGTGNQPFLTVTGGVVDFASDLNFGALPASNNANAGALTIDGGTLRYGGASSYTWSNTRGITVGGNGGVVDVPGTTEVTLPNSSLGLAGSGLLTKVGAGRLQLNTAQINGFTGKYVINAGTLGFNSHFALGASTTTTQADYITLNGGTLRYTGPLNYILDSRRGITLTGSGGALDAASTTMDVDGVVSGTQGGKLTIAASSIVELGSVNTYDGPTQIDANSSVTVRVLANGGTDSGIGRSSAAAENLILNGGSLSYGGNAPGTTDRRFTVTQLGGGFSASFGLGGLTLASTDPITMTGAGSRTITLNSCFSGGTPCSGVMNPAIVDPASGSTSLTVFGGGHWTLTNLNNNYTGNTTIGSTARLKLGASGVIPDASAIEIVGAAAATFDLNGFDETAKTLGGTNGVVALGANRLTLANPAGETFSGTITGAGGSIVKSGAGMLTLSGANTYSGDTWVQAGTLKINNAYLSNSADVYINSGATLNLNFSGSDTVDSLFINGVSQLAGIWGAIGSGATYQTSRLTGTGRLLVTNAITIPGDYNGNGAVDAADYIAWRNGGPLQNEVDGAGTINQADYVAWRERFGNVVSGSGVGSSREVPEPASILFALFGLGLAAFVGSRRARRLTF
jgi:fibronectin-binding autotransporter adhesin